LIIEFEDACWFETNVDWKQNLVELLSLLARRHQHAILAKVDLILAWCDQNLPSHLDYFRTRLASAQLRANAITIRVFPLGDAEVSGPPPWTLTAYAAFEIVNQPLRLVLENDRTDRIFVESTVSNFSSWCSQSWVAPDNGGGSEMQSKIRTASAHPVARWRTFFLFDSDRLHPSELSNGWNPPPGDSCQGHKFEVDCAGMPSNRWHRLNRRSIENYLPRALLEAQNLNAATVLFDQSIGDMAHFYNFKQGLAGDGIHPVDPNRIPRASRSQGFWSSLQPDVITALQNGFGKNIALEFDKIPRNYSWPAGVLAEMDSLSDALQDAM
jgi:hypothetical protein